MSSAALYARALNAELVHIVKSNHLNVSQMTIISQ